ncbi:MAG TPA: CopD family protein, partial [Acidimicrobiales bacterium]|nr:CopD family protein [Acidimicrobiales bacterium]
DALLDTGYGRLILAKSGLLFALAAFGAVNHYRNVPAAGRSLRGLRRVGSVEVAVTAAVFAVTGFLTTAAPPAKDRAPVSAERVSARFALPANPAASETALDFVEGPAGIYSASGTGLPVPGRWRITVAVQRGDDAVEVPLQLVTAVPKTQVTESRVPGQLTLWDVALPQGRSVQIYTDPERPGPTQFHATYFSSDGKELAIESATVTSIAGEAQPVTSTPRRLGPGHFVADLTAPTGEWTLELTAITPEGDYLFVPLDLPMPK